jgi:tRNA 2-selenouridine synthase
MLDNVWPELKKLLVKPCTVQILPADRSALPAWHEFDTVIDARSPGRIRRRPPARRGELAVTSNNAERHEIGTLYKQVNAPSKPGSAARLWPRANIARHISREVMDKPKDWKPLVYCWRGGKRSGSLSP